MANMIGLDVVLETYALSLRLFNGKQLDSLAKRKGLQRKCWFLVFQESDDSLRARLLKEFAERGMKQMVDRIWRRNEHGHIEVVPNLIDRIPHRGKSDDDCPFC